MNRAEHLVMEERHMDKLYASSNFAVRWFFNRRLDTVVGLLPHGQMKVLDAGCGEGHLLQMLRAKNPESELHGLDILDSALRQADQRIPSACLRQGDVCCLPYHDDEFNAVFCSDVLEHIHDYPIAIAEIKRVIKPGGHLIVINPNETLWTMARFVLGRRPVKVPDHVNDFSDKQIARAVGWTVAVQKNLPFGLPFRLSLCTVMKFEKP